MILRYCQPIGPLGNVVSVIFRLMFVIDILIISCEIAHMWKAECVKVPSTASDMELS